MNSIATRICSGSRKRGETRWATWCDSTIRQARARTKSAPARRLSIIGPPPADAFVRKDVIHYIDPAPGMQPFRLDGSGAGMALSTGAAGGEAMLELLETFGLPGRSF